MSHNCYSEIVPFAKHCFFEGNPEKSVEASILFNTYAYQEGECDFQAHLTQEEIDSMANLPIMVGDWEYWREEDIGKRGSISGHLWKNIRKPTFEIWIVNSSQYSHVGEFSITIVGNNPSHIKEFKKDFKDLMTTDLQIEEASIVERWM